MNGSRLMLIEVERSSAAFSVIGMCVMMLLYLFTTNTPKVIEKVDKRYCNNDEKRVYF